MEEGAGVRTRANITKMPPLWIFLIFIVLFSCGIWVATAFYAHAPVPSVYPARSSCWSGDWRLIAIHDLSNSIMFLQYMLLPGLLVWLAVVEKMWRVKWIFPVQAAEWCNFIVWCGISHLIARVEIYRASPWLLGGVLVVAVISGFVAFGHTLSVVSELRIWLRSVRISEIESEREYTEKELK